jgi:hypothetical protein
VAIPLNRAVISSDAHSPFVEPILTCQLPLLALVAARLPVIRNVRTLPTLQTEAITPYSSDWLGSSSSAG